MSYGFASIFGKRFKNEDPILIATGQLTASSMVMLPLCLMFENPFAVSTPTLEMIIALLGLAIICTAFAYILFFKILSSAGATNVSLVTLLVPVSAVFLGAIWLGETISYREIWER